MRKILHLIIATIFIFVFSYLNFAQDINGTYSSSYGHITIANNKMIITRMFYEFYGQLNTVYSYKYKVIEVDEKSLELKLRRSRIIEGPKCMSGSGRVWPNSHNPKIDGVYEYKIIDDGLELTSIDNSKKIIFKKKRS